MTKEQHQARHKELHKSFDELIADFIMQNPGRLPSNTPVMEVMSWSYRQTQDPTPMPGGEHDLNVQTAEPENLQDKIFALEKQVRELEEERNSFIGVIHEHD
jgi:hypothetical protein